MRCGLLLAGLALFARPAAAQTDAEGGMLDLDIIDNCFVNATIARAGWLGRYRG